MKINNLRKSAKVGILAACFFGLLGGQVIAQDSKSDEQLPITLTIEKAVEYANSHSRTLKASQIDLEITKRAKDNSLNILWPTVTASVTASRANDYIPGTSDIVGAAISPLVGQTYVIPDDYDSEKDRWTGIGNVSVSLNLSLAQIYAIRATHAQYEAGEITWQQAVRQNELNVRKLFYALLLQQESLKVSESNLENARQRARQAETNYRNGMVSELSLLQAQVSYQNQRPTVEKARQELAQSLDSFAFLLGMPVGTKIELEGSIKPTYVELNADEIFQEYGMNNLDVQNLQKNINVLKMNLGAVNLQSYTPALALSYNYQPILMTGGEMTDSDTRFDNGSLSITLAWTLSDLFPWSSTRQSAKDIKDNIRKLEVQLATLIQNNELTVRKNVDSLNQAKDAIESNERNVTLAQRSYDMTAAAYRNGTAELLDLRDAENSLNSAKLGALSEQYNYLSYLLDLEYTLNTTLIKQ